MVAQALPGEPEPWGLLALLAYCQARAVARRSPAGDYVPLHAQDPSRWDRTLLRQAESALARASACGRLGPFQLEAAIQSLHTERGLGCPVSPDALRVLYDGLVALHPTLGARVSRACAIGAADGAAAAVAALDVVAAESAREIAAYQPYWAARAHWLTAAGRTADAEAARQRALGLTGDAAVRRFLLRGAG